ncbi:MAG: hypothetical protein E7170_00240 [Firmicutes bacterium]|nr:hypothetical protein [Bacillota bacterium]
MEKEDYKIVNEIIEDYINYLYRSNYIFLDNASFFHELTNNYEDFIVKSEPFKFKKINATDSFKLVRQFYDIYYKEEKEELENLFNSGVFDIYYVDELIKEKIYLEPFEYTFSQGTRNNKFYIRLPLNGDIRDVHLIIHEVRHQLNQPQQGRNIENNTLTEALSMFDEFLAYEHFKKLLDEETKINLKKRYFDNFSFIIPEVNFITKLIIIKTELGEITLEHYNMLFDKITEEELVDKLNKYLNVDSYKQIKTDFKNWYVLGLFLISYMHQEYLKNPNYLEKVKELNKHVKNNEDVLNCLKSVDIDLSKQGIIEELRKSYKEEIEDIKDKKHVL